MKQLNVDELERSVDSFQRTVSALERIQEINTQLADVSQTIKENIELIQVEEERHTALSKSLQKSIADFSEKNTTNTGIIKDAIQSQTKELTEMLENSYAIMNAAIGGIAVLYDVLISRLKILPKPPLKPWKKGWERLTLMSRNSLDQR